MKARSLTLTFTFDGVAMRGAEGDTLAAALLANGVRLVGRSFKYHRPRGISAAGVEEANALVGVGQVGRFEPNTRATDVFLYEGLTAISQNRWPSLNWDLGAVTGLIAPFIPAGFYYKTFLGSPALWKVYEHFIRRAAGLGRPPTAPEVDVFEHRAAFCDCLVVGAGPSGLAAAKAAAQAGERVILVEQDLRLGGSLLRDPETAPGQSVEAWINEARAIVVAAGGRVLSRTTAVGYHDHNLITLNQKLTEPGQAPGPDGLAQRQWRVRAGRVVLATGALERGLLFAHNDRPGVMLSQAARTYIQRYGVLPGRRVVVATAHDDAYLTAQAMANAGAQVVAVLDTRATGLGGDPRFPVYTDAEILAATGSHAVTGVDARVAGKSVRFAADLLVVCGGFTPTVHLHMQAGGTLAWNEALGAFTPDTALQGQISVGAAVGEMAPGAALHPPAGVDLKKTFVDPQNDVTIADLDLAWREGFVSVEHLKRYTTTGMATDQGKNSNILSLARLAYLQNRAVAEVGTTTFRPPYTPVTLGALAGAAVGSHVAPTRRLWLHDQHMALAPIWQPSGYWMRPRVYARSGETPGEAAFREARTVRAAIGFTDVSTLGKFEIAGPDAAILLERVCATPVAKLKIGRGRYTFMLREDGLVFDDGTLWRLADDRYLLTSSTGGADRMEAHLAYVRQVLSSNLRVSVAPVQEHWSALALAGPNAKTVLTSLAQDAPPAHMTAVRTRIADTPVWVLAASYSGERAFEIYAAGPSIAAVWGALGPAVAAQGGCPYGLDAMDLLRIEKGHLVVGAEIDGRTTARDLGLDRMLRPGGGYVGWQGQSREALQSDDRMQLVGLEAVSEMIPEGAMLLSASTAPPVGHVTSAGRRVLGSGAVALGLLRAGRSQHGAELIATSPTRGQNVRVRVVPPIFHDKDGEAYRD